MTSVTERSSGIRSWREELLRRIARPQRHRLLQGYPMLPLMRRAAPELFSWQRVEALRPTGEGQHTRDLLSRRAVVDFMG